MIPHEVITPFSVEWWVYNVVTCFLIFITIWIGKNLAKKNENTLTLGIAYLFIFEFFFMDLYNIYIGLWSIQDSLPLHLCSIMWFVAIYMLITKKQWAFELLLFIGMPGGIHSLLTPELTHGDSLIHKIDFFLAHGGLVLTPFYGIFVLKMWPRKSSWLFSFLKLQLLVIIVGALNYLLESNYMYLANPPIANNPLIPEESSFFGQWPYYIIIFEIAVLVHAFIINVPFFLKGSQQKK
jgi:hypothetical integral membrane protein (TIGR02206 family)